MTPNQLVRRLCDEAMRDCQSIFIDPPIPVNWRERFVEAQQVIHDQDIVIRRLQGQVRHLPTLLYVAAGAAAVAFVAGWVVGRW